MDTFSCHLSAISRFHKSWDRIKHLLQLLRHRQVTIVRHQTLLLNALVWQPNIHVRYAMGDRPCYRACDIDRKRN